MTESKPPQSNSCAADEWGAVLGSPMLAMPPLLMEINSHHREVAETLIQVGLGLGSQAGILTLALEEPILLRFVIPSESKEAGTPVSEQPS